jgi:hypothetical protein
MFRYALFCFVISAPLLFASTGTQAAITISKHQSENMNCTNNVCSPTATNAILSVAAIDNLLAFGSVTITTTGAGVQANDIAVTAPFKWSASTSLTLDAYQSITISNAITDKGTGAVSFITNDGGSGGTLSFSAPGSISLANLSDTLTINGTAYTLVKSIKVLAADIALNPSGSYALAESFEASGEGTFKGSAIPTTFTGTFQGLGNTIYDLAVYGIGTNQHTGLFGWVGSAGTIENLNLVRVSVIDTKKGGVAAGAIAGENDGTLSGDSVDGFVQGQSGSGYLGGLAGYNVGTIMTSHSTATVSATGEGTRTVGGLVGEQDGIIVNSYATGAMSGDFIIGGLIGEAGGVSSGSVAGSYATGNVTGGAYAGGLIGVLRDATVANCYATGALTSKRGNELGGFVGEDANYYDGGTITASYSAGAITDTEYRGLAGGFAGDTGPVSKASDAYWDTTTSGTNTGVGSGDSNGITGLTTTQFQSGLPAGFDPTVWAENPSINDGLPYLIANPPP